MIHQGERWRSSSLCAVASASVDGDGTALTAAGRRGGDAGSRSGFLGGPGGVLEFLIGEQHAVEEVEGLCGFGDEALDAKDDLRAV